MSTIYADNNPVQTLVERKKLQWAREREELAGLNENVPWGSRESLTLYDRPNVRSRYATKYQKETDYLRLDSNPSRRQSLPPLYKNQNITYTSNEKLDKEMGGETSGYGSDNPNQTPEHFPQTNWNNHHLGYESSSSGREDRLKWGDRGVHVGKFWEPKEMNNFGKNSDTPGWVKRGLERDTELVVSNTSPAESPEQDYMERPCTGSSSSQNRCYIRGQNVHLEPDELAERERRRQIALAHQEAIRQQLEEREKRRQEERARRIREEYEEELRIAREQEIERQRKEQERRIREEKIEREMKRKEALREAIRIAEKEAKEEKKKQKLMRQNINISENIVEVEKIQPIKMVEQQDISETEQESPTESENYPPPPPSLPDVIKENENNKNLNANLDHNKNLNYVLVNNNNNNSNSTYNNNNNNENEQQRNENGLNNKYNNNNVNVNNFNNNPLALLNQQVSQENLALVLQNPLDSLQNIQFAVLIPSTNTLPIAVPLATDRSVVSTARTENRLLTPTQYRNKKQLCDSSTQTDLLEFKQEDNRDKYIREKLANLEITLESRLRKERRSRSELRENVEERPKWGVNRPPTRYLKQSEKDPLYQRRKMRQKMRQIKVYEDKRSYSPHSSDDSQIASPRSYRKKDKRESRRLWRKNEHLFAENVRVYQTEIIPLESDKDHIYIKSKSHQCCCMCRREKEKYADQIKVVDILKIEHNSPRECLQYKNESIQDKTKLPECKNSSFEDSSEVLEKLNGLLLKQEHWDETSNNSLVYSPSRNP